MRITIINHSDNRGGAAVVSFRLMLALRRAGHDARMLVAHKETDSPYVALAAPRSRLKAAFLKEHMRIFCHNGFSRKDLFKVSVATDGVDIDKHPWVVDADVLILGWINQGLLSLNQIKRLAQHKPTLWIMHDMWCATGICHHAGSCNRYTDSNGCHRCPLLHGAASNNDISHTTFERKRELYADTSITFVAVSSWLKHKCSQAQLMRHIDVHVVPNPFPLENFHIGKKGASPKTVVMGAARLDDPVKGFDMAIEILNKIDYSDFKVLFFGQIKDRSVLEGLKVPYSYLGPINDTNTLANVYAGADVVISTSRYETLPGTIIEGMASGCTPVAFDSGGQKDIIVDNKTGFLIKPYDIDAFAHAISSALIAPFEPQALRKSIDERFCEDAVVKSLLSIIS